MLLGHKTAHFDDKRKITFDWSAFLTSLAVGTTIGSSAWDVDDATVTLTSPTSSTTGTTVIADFGVGSPAPAPYLARIGNTVTASNGEVQKHWITVSVSG